MLKYMCIISITIFERVYPFFSAQSAEIRKILKSNEKAEMMKIPKSNENVETAKFDESAISGKTGHIFL